MANDCVYMNLLQMGEHHKNSRFCKMVKHAALCESHTFGGNAVHNKGTVEGIFLFPEHISEMYKIFYKQKDTN